ncbi:hypothetical protein DFH11DRAFT_886426 [Phellopilus nigrolimitatus]|nr:hypothetical protein DFH11DRAFT_886426 [Phellopilus nigrolimitatus]
MVSVSWLSRVLEGLVSDQPNLGDAKADNIYYNLTHLRKPADFYDDEAFWNGYIVDEFGFVLRDGPNLRGDLDRGSVDSAPKADLELVELGISLANKAGPAGARIKVNQKLKVDRFLSIFSQFPAYRAPISCYNKELRQGFTQFMSSVAEMFQYNLPELRTVSIAWDTSDFSWNTEYLDDEYINWPDSEDDCEDYLSESSDMDMNPAETSDSEFDVHSVTDTDNHRLSSRQVSREKYNRAMFLNKPSRRNELIEEDLLTRCRHRWARRNSDLYVENAMSDFFKRCQRLELIEWYLGDCIEWENPPCWAWRKLNNGVVVGDLQFEKCARMPKAKLTVAVGREAEYWASVCA